MTETEELADIIALSIHAATQPLLTKIAVLETRPVGYGTKDAWDALQETLSDLRTRLMAVEGRAPVPGPPGPQGERGEPGAVGLKGLDGVMGPAGERGPMGEVGQRGPTGEKGESGLNGKDGAPGLAGKDGTDGLNGKDGAAGLHGKDGKDAVLEPTFLEAFSSRLESVEIKADLAQRIERDVMALKSQMLQIKLLDSADTIPPDRVAAVIADVFAQELAALGASPWPSS